MSLPAWQPNEQQPPAPDNVEIEKLEPTGTALDGPDLNAAQPTARAA